MGIKVIVLLGAPGAGKGTIAESIVGMGRHVHLSTGDMLRSAISMKSPVGILAEGYVRRGELVPDEVIVKIVMARMDSGSGGISYLFDGFPRTLEQARMLDEEFARRNVRISDVVFLDVPREVLLDRLAGRRTCAKCGANYHVRNIPPKSEGVCDACGGVLSQREDDMPDTVLKRLEVFERQTEKLIEYYQKRGVLRRLDASGRREETFAKIEPLLK